MVKHDPQLVKRQLKEVEKQEQKKSQGMGANASPASANR